MSFADKLSDIFKDIFPDSKVAKEYASKRTKATCILNQALAPHFLKETIETMKSDVFHYQLMVRMTVIWKKRTRSPSDFTMSPEIEL